MLTQRMQEGARVGAYKKSWILGFRGALIRLMERRSWRQYSIEFSYIFDHKLFRPHIASFSLNKMIQPLGSEGNVMAWLKTVDLVVNLEGIPDVGSLIPLFLEGGAQTLYLELIDEDKKDTEIIRIQLTWAFSEIPRETCEKFKNVKWADESVNVYTNKIQRIIRLVGFVVTSSDLLAKMAFTSGFPEQISREFQQVNGFKRMDVSQLIPRARLLTCNRPLETKSVSAIWRGDEEKSC